MTPQTFQFFSEYLYQRSGLSLPPEKEYLLENRMSNVLKTHNIPSFDDLAMKLKRMPSGTLADDVVEAMSVTETSFFRDRSPFDKFTDIMLPHILKTRSSMDPIRIWSAAASSGQEAYTLAILCKERMAAIGNRRIEILATDISPNVLEKAKAGVYSQFEVQRGMPTELLLKYFEQKGDTWAISQEIKSMVRFEQFNLMSSFASKPRFDIVFCRNVLIYFDIDTKRAVMEKISSVLAPDGFMLLGSAETTMGICDEFVSDTGDRNIFRKKSYLQDVRKTA